MRATVDLDDALVNAAMELTGARTKSEVVRLALQELVRLRSKAQLTALAGKIRFTKGFEHKAMRRLRK
jgi:Arc/MetJ family transcription regulator